MQNLIFDPTEHTYTLDGAVLPSVTEIVKPLGVDYDDLGDLELVVEAAAERGTVCHKVLEMLLYGETEIEYPSAYEPYIEAVRLFLLEHQITPLAVEIPVASPHLNVAGTPDLLCEFDGKLTLIDYKFVSQVAKKPVKAQLNGYLKIYSEYGVFPEELYCVQFLNTGLYRLYPVKIDPTEFDLCLRLYQLKNEKQPRGRIE